MAAGEVLAPGSCGVVAVGGALKLGGRTAVKAVESLLMSSCFRKGAESRRRHRACGAPSLLVWRSEPDGTPVLFPVAWGRVMMAPPVDVVGPCPRLGDVEAPPRSRSSLSSEAEIESEPLGRARRRPSAEARAESEPWVGRSGVRRLPGPSPSPSPGSGEAEFPMVPEAGPDCLSASLYRAAQQSERRRRRCPSVRPVSGAAK
jgi:hypothetical protein